MNRKGGGGENIFDGSWRLFRESDQLWDARQLPAEPEAEPDDPEAQHAKNNLRKILEAISRDGPRPPVPFVTE